MSLSRRNFLRAQGAVLSLPFLHSLARATGEEPDQATPSKKLLIMYIPNGIVRRCFFPGEEEAAISPTFGHNCVEPVYGGPNDFTDVV